MAINSTHHDGSSAISQQPRLIDLRFSLRRIMARTALADIFWANDVHGAAENMPEKNVLVLLVNPALTKLDSFNAAWQQILGRPSPPAAAYPDVIAYGKHEGEYWLALNNVSGVLLSERISELDERGIPLNTALDTLHNIQQTLDSIQAGAYGYIEPGVLQYTEQGNYKILNAPLVKVMQLLTSVRKGTINQLALHSAYLSPSVSVGDVPVTEDDTFSTASLLYTMLSSNPPLGESTLTAVAHGDRPLPLKKLKKQSWEAIDQALTYQRSARPENPEKFLTLLKKSNRKKVLFPMAVLAALGVTVFAGQHLISRLGDYIPAGALLSNNQQDTAGESGLLSGQTDNINIPSTQTDSQNQSTQAKAQNQPNNNNANSNTTSLANNSSDDTTPEIQSEQAATNSNASSMQATSTDNGTQNPTAQDTQASNQPQNVNAAGTSSLLSPDKTADQVATAETGITPQSDNTNNIESAATNSNTQPASSITNVATATETPASAKQNNVTAAVTPDTTDNNQNNTEQQQTINQLLKQAVAAFNAGQLEDSDSGKQGVISLLRELAKIDDDNRDAEALIGKVVEKKYHLAERRLGAKKFAEAEALVQDSDQLIREFMLTDKLQRQVRMESKVSILRDEQAQVDDLLSDARSAINLGTLSQSDGQDHALSYLRRVLFKQPGNAEAVSLLSEIASTRQQAAHRALSTGELAQAKAYLRESERLVKKYKLKDLRADQKAIKAQYDALVRQSEDNTTNTVQTDNTEVIDLIPQQTNQQQTEAASAQQRQLQQQAENEAETARQLQLQRQAENEAEAARQLQLQQQAENEAEAARQLQLQQQAEAARQHQLQQQAQAALRQRQLQQQQEQAAIALQQRQLQQQQEQAAARQLQQQQAAERQRQLQQQQAAAHQNQLQQQQTQSQQINGFIVDENGFVIGEPPIAGDLDTAPLNADGTDVIAIPVQRLQPNTIGVQEIAPDNMASNPQAVPVWEVEDLQQIRPQPADAAVNVQVPQQLQPANSLQAQFDNFQTQANAVNVPFPTEETIPELQEVPLSAIEEILPEQSQQ